MSFLGASQNERAIGHEAASRRQFYWMSKHSDAWNRNPRNYSGRIAIDGSLRRSLTGMRRVVGLSCRCTSVDNLAVVWRWRNYVRFLGDAKDHNKV